MKVHRYKVINKKRFFTSLSCIILIVFTLMILGLSVNANFKDQYEFFPVYVSEGDSLWSLSKKFNNTDLNIRDYIDNVININKINSALIEPGQLLFFPISKGDTSF